MILKKTIDIYKSTGNDGRHPKNSTISEALSRDKVTKESLAEFGLVEASGPWGYGKASYGSMGHGWNYRL